MCGAIAHVCFGSQADICTAPAHVRFTPKSDIKCDMIECPLWANSGHCGLDFPTVVGPMKQCLTLPSATEQIAGFTILLNLLDVSADRPPAPNLPRIFLHHAAAHVVAAIPLEPAARVAGMNPSLPSPFCQRLARVDPEKIKPAITSPARQLGLRKPTLWKLTLAIGHVLATEHS